MKSISYRWRSGEQERELVLVRIDGTAAAPYPFGDSPSVIAISVPEFYIGATPITQAFWSHIGGPTNPAAHVGPDLPVENVSWDGLLEPGGFLERLNASPAAEALRDQAGRPLTFRLPTETEWEYAARGGPHWRDDYRYSGSHDIAAVAWYEMCIRDSPRRVARAALRRAACRDFRLLRAHDARADAPQSARRFSARGRVHRGLRWH